jgi:hypothetical protein
MLEVWLQQNYVRANDCCRCPQLIYGWDSSLWDPKER